MKLGEAEAEEKKWKSYTLELDKIHIIHSFIFFFSNSLGICEDHNQINVKIFLLEGINPTFSALHSILYFKVFEHIDFRFPSENRFIHGRLTENNIGNFLAPQAILSAFITTFELTVRTNNFLSSLQSYVFRKIIVSYEQDKTRTQLQCRISTIQCKLHHSRQVSHNYLFSNLYPAVRKSTISNRFKRVTVFSPNFSHIESMICSRYNQ